MDQALASATRSCVPWSLHLPQGLCREFAGADDESLTEFSLDFDSGSHSLSVLIRAVSLTLYIHRLLRSLAGLQLSKGAPASWPTC